MQLTSVGSVLMLQSVIFFLPYVAHGNTHCNANLWSWRAVCQRGPTCDLQRGRELCGRWRPTSCFVFTSSTRRSLLMFVYLLMWNTPRMGWHRPTHVSCSWLPQVKPLRVKICKCLCLAPARNYSCSGFVKWAPKLLFLLEVRVAMHAKLRTFYKVHIISH